MGRRTTSRFGHTAAYQKLRQEFTGDRYVFRSACRGLSCSSAAAAFRRSTFVAAALWAVVALSGDSHAAEHIATHEAVATTNTLGVGTLASSSCGTNRPRPQDEIWVVNTRGLSTCRCPSPQDLTVRRFVDGQWCNESTESLWTTTDAITTIYVHGNRIDRQWAYRHGWLVYQRIASGAKPEEKLRFVIWSWASDRVFGPIRDARLKAQKANSEGFLLGWFLSHYPPENRLSLIGYSYGARVVSSGLHVAAGGTLDGRTLPLPPQHREVHTSLLAAAMHRDGLSNSGPFCAAQQQISELLLFFNSEDPILRRYFWLDKQDRQEALGFVGFCRRPITPLVQQINVATCVGRSHDVEKYLAASQVVSMIRENALWRN